MMDIRKPLSTRKTYTRNEFLTLPMNHLNYKI